MNQCTKRLLVVGGTGFLGLNICRSATLRGWKVTSLSRSGKLKQEKEEPTPEWVSKVDWAQGDSLQPESYRDLLKDCTSVVHTVGILMENNYKNIVRSNNPLAALMNNLVDCNKQEANPFKRSSTPTRQSTSPDTNTYERMNRDTAVMLANEAAMHDNIQTFAYISAADVFPFIDKRYISTKRDAEAEIQAHPEFRSIILRPGFMYSDHRPFTVPFAGALGLFGQFTKNLREDVDYGLLTSHLKKLGTSPLRVETVSEAVVTALERPTVKGVLNVPEILELSQ
ncbi:putative oxidoreductase [Basidiobolus meristosporus CBS 931.73]|uniref:Putative oxidoreductase n=1 Tax=Basidiobolus meristosporus CBS 931.73 TaxID=1314790 RepID=A0A1Y1XSI9_9FUNG|nr:putative oxidoreductase [Basidiobolus meristosporus CBS 931.73]ORY01242.1 putative oxidoreductase [Basidiobolus meristosporus CBS 931.73]|eukprot:ORX88693.1 putative oxidoreductase [Basidiobolus meristosporus CBS 931.73]